MKQLITYSLTIIFFCVFQNTANAEEIVLTKLVSGKIGIKKPGAKKYKMIKEGDVIEVGSWIMTLKKTDVTLCFYKTDRKKGDVNSTLQIGSYSKIKIDSFSAAKEKVTTEIKARAGHIISSVDPEEAKGNDYKVETPQITAAVKGTTMDIITNSKYTFVKMITGLSFAEAVYGSKFIGLGQSIEANEEAMSNSIDMMLAAMQNPVLYRGASPTEIAFQSELNLVPLSSSFSGQSVEQQSQSNTNSAQLAPCWEYIDFPMMFTLLPFPVFPAPGHCDPLPDPPPIIVYGP